MSVGIISDVACKVFIPYKMVRIRMPIDDYVKESCRGTEYNNQVFSHFADIQAAGNQNDFCDKIDVYTYQPHYPEIVGKLKVGAEGHGGIAYTA